MAGSKGGKHSQGKGKSKTNEPDTSNKMAKVSNCKPDLALLKIDTYEAQDPKDKNPQPDTSFSLPTSQSSYMANQLEELLYFKVEALYSRAEERLLRSGYSMAEVETAILHSGYFQGEMDLLDNILKNSIAYIEKEVEPKSEAFKDMNELCKCMLETLIQCVMQAQMGIQRSDAVRHLLCRNRVVNVPSTTTTSQLRSGDIYSIFVHWSSGSSSQCRNEDAGALGLSSAEKVISFEKVGIFRRTNLTPAFKGYLRLNVLVLTAAIERQIGVPVIRQQAIQSVSGKPTEVAEKFLNSDLLRSIADYSDEASLRTWLDSDSEDPKTALIVGLIKSIRDLHERVKEQKQWAQWKMIDSAKRLGKDLLELKMLRVESFVEGKYKYDRLYNEKICSLMLMEAEQPLRKVYTEAIFLNDTVKRLERKKSQMRADIEAVKLNTSECERDLREVLKRERRCMKRLVDVEKQARTFHSQIKEEKQRALQMEADLLHAEKEADEAEKKWRQEIREKEEMFALLAEEIQMVETQKANSRTQLFKLQQKVEIDSQLARDDVQRLENELSHLYKSQKNANIFLEDLDFLNNNVEESSSASSAPYESSETRIRHWICMMCLENEVSIVFLPCTHQVVCSPCYLKNFKLMGDWCPYCKTKIEESIRVYGPSS